MIGKIIEFHRPNGKRVNREFEVPDRLAEKYVEIKKEDLEFCVEELSTGVISATITDFEYGDYKIDLFEPPLNVQQVFIDWIETFDLENYREWRDRHAQGGC